MGYIVGRNSSPTVVADTHAGGSGKPIVVDTAPRTSTPLPEEPTSTPAATPPAEPTPAAVEKPSPSKTSAAREAKREEPKRPEPKPAPVEVSKHTAVGEPAPGVYLQVVATSRADAEIVSESLLKKGFRSTVAPVPDSTLHRVLVGPVKDAAEMAEVRTRLEGSGFKPYVRKY